MPGSRISRIHVRLKIIISHQSAVFVFCPFRADLHPHSSFPGRCQALPWAIVLCPVGAARVGNPDVAVSSKGAKWNSPRQRLATPWGKEAAPESDQAPKARNRRIDM